MACWIFGQQILYPERNAGNPSVEFAHRGCGGGGPRKDVQPQQLHHGSQCVLVSEMSADFCLSKNAWPNHGCKNLPLRVTVRIVEGNKQHPASTGTKIR